MSEMNTPVPQPNPNAGPQNGMGTAALVLGIVGLVTVWCTYGIPAILAIVFGAIGLSKANKGLATNRTAALWGLILGAVTVGGAILLAALGVAGAILSSLTSGSM